MAELVKLLSPVLGDWSIWTGGFEPWSNETNDYKIDTSQALSIIRIGQGLVGSVDNVSRYQVMVLIASSPIQAVL